MQYSCLVALMGLAAASGALAQTEPQAATSCGLREPEGPRPRGTGIVLRIQDAVIARADIPGREARRGGSIDSRYHDDLRVTVRQEDGRVDTFDVPPGLTAHVGDHVRLQGSYRSKTSACSYIPQMAIPNDSPTA